MARIAFFDKHEPVDVNGKMVCQCGLSENFPFCDGSHAQTSDEDSMKLYQYVNGEKVVIGEMKQSSGCCGGGCHDDEGHGCGSHEEKEGGCCKDHHE